VVFILYRFIELKEKLNHSEINREEQKKDWSQPVSSTKSHAFASAENFLFLKYM
jgi:hypothetical protein